MANNAESIIMKGAFVLIGIILILAIFAKLIPSAMDAGNELTPGGICSELLSSPTYCLQNTSNISSDCGTYTQYAIGTYAFNGNWYNQANLIDNNFSSWSECNASEECYMHVRYYIPTDAISMSWIVKDDKATLTLPIDMSYLATVNATHRYIEVRAVAVNGSNASYYAWSGITPHYLGKASTIGRIYEESFKYFFPTSNCYIDEDDICASAGTDDYGEACPTTPENIPLGGLFSGSGILFLILMIALFMTIMKIVLHKKK